MKGIDYSGLPPHLREGMRAYLEDRVKPGGFLTAVLEGDLYGAIFKADEISLECLRGIARWIVFEAPECCYGSRAKVASWIAGKVGEAA